MSTVPPTSRRRINDMSSAVTLPDELIGEVLSFLDVKSLTPLKCVSKSWNSLISDPFFVKKHLTKSSRNPQLATFSTQYSGKSVTTVFNAFPIHSLFENVSTTVSNDDPIYKLMDEGYYEFVSSCNGLVCLLSDSFNAGYREFSLRFWNPATRLVSEKLGSFGILVNEKNPCFKFSFGYDNSTDKYKVVAFRPNDVRVFTLGNNVWKNIQSFPTPCLSSHNSGVYLNNSLNWFANRNKQFVIISLDLGMETYTKFLPPRDFDQVTHDAPTVCLLKECLCFAHYSQRNDFVIWQMREFGVEESWSKLLNFSYRNLIREYYHLLPLHVFENGNILILARNERQVILYNRRDNRVDKTRITNEKYWFSFKHYVESLVSTS